MYPYPRMLSLNPFNHAELQYEMYGTKGSEGGMYATLINPEVTVKLLNRCEIWMRTRKATSEGLRCHSLLASTRQDVGSQNTD